MIEIYAFLAMFAAQILSASVMNPTRLIRYMRGWSTRFGSERFRELYPEVDYERFIARFATGFRAVNIVIALLGVTMLFWFFDRAQRPDWTGGVPELVVVYYLLQMSPLIVLAIYGLVRYRKVLLQPSQEIKRKATLQRRGLFDFVSPVAVIIAVASYVLFMPFAIWLDLHVHGNESLSRQFYITALSVTALYALNGFVVYKYLYGRKNPLVSDEGRTHSIGLNVRGCVYSAIAGVWFIAMFSLFSRFDLRNWTPFAMCVFFVICTHLAFNGLNPPREPGEDQPG